MEKKLEVTIEWGDSFMHTELQKKSFKDMNAAIEFCRKHYNNIWMINSTRTNRNPISHFLIRDAIEHPDFDFS